MLNYLITTYLFQYLISALGSLELMKTYGLITIKTGMEDCGDLTETVTIAEAMITVNKWNWGITHPDVYLTLTNPYTGADIDPHNFIDVFLADAPYPTNYI